MSKATAKTGKATATTVKAKGASSKPEGAKRVKTGGRKSETLEEKLAKAKKRSEIAALHDGTTLDSELAALYLGMSEKKLEELRHHDGAGPTIAKYPDPNAKGQNQPVIYMLGDLRDYQKKMKATGSFDAAIKAQSMFQLATQKRSFFAHLDGKFVGDLIADAQDPTLRDRDELMSQLAAEQIQVVSLTPLEAGARRWSNPKAHRDLVETIKAAMSQEKDALDAAALSSELEHG